MHIPHPHLPFGWLPEEEQNATVSGAVYYDGVISGPYVWALEANGSKAAEVILPDGNGSFPECEKGRYDFRLLLMAPEMKSTRL